MEGDDASDAARLLRAPTRHRRASRRLLERLVPRLARILGRASGPRRSSTPSTSTRTCCPRSPRGRRRSPDRARVRRGQPGSSLRPWSRSDAAMRWPRPSGRACSLRARSVTSSERPSRYAPRARSRARIRRCSSNATPTPTPTSGCSRTRGSSPAETCDGGGTSSPRSNGTRSRSDWGTRTTSLSRRPGTSRQARKDWCSSRACRARWHRNGTAPPGGLLRADARAHPRPHDAARSWREARSPSGTSSTR